MSLRRFARPAVAILLILLGPVVAHTQVLLDPNTQPKFVNPLPIAARIDMTGGGYLEIEARQAQQHLGIYDPVTGSPLMTTLWGYNGSYPGPTIVARSNVPLDIRWLNGLVDEFNVPLPHLLPVDTSIHWAMPDNWPACGVPLTAHVHGGHTESASDGLPDSWYTPGFAQTGPGWVKEVLHYDNDQEAGTVWYHDHVLGMTRLNVYAGLAGFYLLRDDNEDYLVDEGFLPTGPYEIEMAIQDKMFTADGALYYPSMPEVPGSPDPSHLPEMFGDVMLVNSMAWPVLDVEPRQYRFRIVNGCDSRFLQCFLTDPNGGPAIPATWKIGNDSGLLFAPVPMTQWVWGPGERVDMVFDFSDPSLWGRTFVLRNKGKTPFPNGAPVDPTTAGQIMAFRVVKPLDTSVYPVTALPVKPDNLRPLLGAITAPVANAPVRKLILFEGEDEYGRLKTKLGTYDEGAMDWNDPITENPMVNDTEVWEIYNTTVDAHPIHLHLVSFLVTGRQPYKGNSDPETGIISNLKLGKNRAVPSDEKSWKDTVIMYPGEVTRIIATFDREGLYVWHCHIVSHEDHEMMRPYYVGPIGIPWPYPLGAGVSAESPASSAAEANAAVSVESVHPNPFNPTVTIRFALKSAGRVDATIYDVAGRMVRALAERDFVAGTHELEWKGDNQSGSPVGSGVYFLRIQTDGYSTTKRLVLLK
jgi:spore coat protein A